VGLVYAHVIVKLCQTSGRFSQLLVVTAKMAFSLYTLQSVVMAILLSGIVPNFGLTATHINYCLIALSFTVIQILIANLYLFKYEQGPLEKRGRKLYRRNVDKN
jgi:uncharacterized protein